MIKSYHNIKRGGENLIENTFVKHKDYAEIIVHSRKHGDVSFKIDLDDLERCSKIHWGLNPFKSKTYNGFYCSTSDLGEGRVLLHRFIMNTPKGMYTDHTEGDIYDNRKSKLRICTPSQNNQNSRKSNRNKSGQKGVYFVHHRGLNKWLANISVNSRLKHLGYFNTKEEAIKARINAEIKYYGEFVEHNKIN